MGGIPRAEFPPYWSSIGEPPVKSFWQTKKQLARGKMEHVVVHTLPAPLKVLYIKRNPLPRLTIIVEPRRMFVSTKDTIVKKAPGVIVIEKV